MCGPSEKQDPDKLSCKYNTLKSSLSGSVKQIIFCSVSDSLKCAQRSIGTIPFDCCPTVKQHWRRHSASCWLGHVHNESALNEHLTVNPLSMKHE